MQAKDIEKQVAEIVYFLRDPRNEIIRYIGCTGNLASRMLSHFDHARNTRRAGYKSEKSKWIRELKLAGLEPKVEVVYSLGLRPVALKVERLLMWTHRETILNDDVPQYDATVDPVMAQAISICAVETLSKYAHSIAYICEDTEEGWQGSRNYISTTISEIADIYRRHLLIAEPLKEPTMS